MTGSGFLQPLCPTSCTSWWRSSTSTRTSSTPSPSTSARGANKSSPSKSNDIFLQHQSRWLRVQQKPWPDVAKGIINIANTTQKALITDSKPARWPLPWGRPKPELGLQMGRQGSSPSPSTSPSSRSCWRLLSKTTMPGCECFRMQRDLPRSPSFLRAWDVGRQKLHPWQVKWTQQVPVATLKLAFNWFLFFSWTRPGETNSLGRSRWMLHHPILNILKIIYTYMCNSAVFKTQNFSFQSWRMGTVLDLPQLWANGPLPMGLW